MAILRVGTVDTEHPYGLCQAIIIGDNHPAVAESTQVLAREKGETTHMPYRPSLPSFIIPSPNRLSRIFNHIDTFAFNDLNNRVHGRALAEQMDGHDRFCPRSDFFTYLGTVEVESFRINIHKYRAGTEPCDHTDSSEE